MTVQVLIDDLSQRGIRLIPEPPKLIVEPASKLTDADRALIRQHKDELLKQLIARVAQCDAERHNADRLAGRGYDVDCSSPGHAAYLARTGQRCACQISEGQQESEVDRLALADGWLPPSPAHAVIEVCQRYGVALSIDTDGTLVVGKAGAKADEAMQPWPSLLTAIEAHLEAVAALVAAGWYLRADFPEKGAA